jgi:hypothetical protein
VISMNNKYNCNSTLRLRYVLKLTSTISARIWSHEGWQYNKISVKEASFLSTRKLKLAMTGPSSPEASCNICPLRGERNVWKSAWHLLNVTLLIILVLHQPLRKSWENVFYCNNCTTVFCYIRINVFIRIPFMN